MSVAFAVKVDEDLPRSLAALIADRGYAVATVLDQGWGGVPDDELMSKIVAEGRLLVTADKGFADIRRYPPGSHPGILLLRPDRESAVEYRSLLAAVLTDHALDQLSGTVAVASSGGVRVRRPASP